MVRPTKLEGLDPSTFMKILGGGMQLGLLGFRIEDVLQDEQKASIPGSSLYFLDLRVMPNGVVLNSRPSGLAFHGVGG